MKTNKSDELMNKTARCAKLENLSYLRAIECYYFPNPPMIMLKYYTVPPISEIQKEELACLGSEILAHFPNESIEEEIIELSEDTPLPSGKQWGYLAPGEPD